MLSLFGKIKVEKYTGGKNVATKKQLRTEMKKKLSQVSEQSYLTLSNKIAKNVYVLEEWENAKVIGLTISGKSEVDTYNLINRAWEENKRVVVPKCYSAEKTMTFREITSFEQLEIVYYGLREPIVNETREVKQHEIDLLFVPGVCFTKAGYRLGHGGGYYDRYLATFKGKTISLVFPIQLIEDIPIEPFDIPVQKIITSEHVINCNG